MSVCWVGERALLSRTVVGRDAPLGAGGSAKNCIVVCVEEIGLILVRVALTRLTVIRPCGHVAPLDRLGGLLG